MRRRKEYFRIRKFARRYDRASGKFVVNVAYETAAPRPSSRVVAVAEGFGLGLDKWEKFVVYDNVELKLSPTDLVYITGDSGSGKSVLLRVLLHDLGDEAVDMNTVQVDPDKPLIETVGKTVEEGLELLSRVGLNDAFLFLRTYNQLSDGQRYRYRVAKLVESDKQWWVMDEFCATLDRDTARIVAFNIQKLARSLDKALIVATTHTDLFEDLNPSVHIHKRFGKEIALSYHPNKVAKECTLVKDMRVEEGTFADYKMLSSFHYRTGRCPAPRRIFALRRGNELCGVIVYSYPPPNTFGRSNVWKGSFQQLQKEVSTIARVIVHPKYRTIGLGAKLVSETIAKAGTPFVETVAVMAKYNPFFEKAGMKRIMESRPNTNVLNAIEQLRQLGFNPILLRSINYCMQKIRVIGKNEIAKIMVELSKKEGGLRKRLLASGKIYPRQEEFLEGISKLDEKGLAAVLKRLSFLQNTKVYLSWGL